MMPCKAGSCPTAKSAITVADLAVLASQPCKGRHPTSVNTTSCLAIPSFLLKPPDLALGEIHPNARVLGYPSQPASPSRQIGLSALMGMHAAMGAQH